MNAPYRNPLPVEDFPKLRTSSRTRSPQPTFLVGVVVVVWSGARGKARFYEARDRVEKAGTEQRGDAVEMVYCFGGAGEATRELTSVREKRRIGRNGATREIRVANTICFLQGGKPKC